MGSFLNKIFNFLSVEFTVMLMVALLDMRFKWAFPAIFVGNLIAGIIIMGVTHGVFKVIGGWRIEFNDLSIGITEMIIKTVEKFVTGVELDLGSFNHIVRKNAHFFAYLVLGILVSNALRGGGVLVYRRIVLALVICILYAASDEVHQLFVPGRGCQVKDVLIDTVGAISGISVYLVLIRIKELY